MRRAGVGRVIAIGALAALAGCVEAKDHVMSGDGNQLTIQYYGDLDATMPLARQYCAQFERVPQRRDNDVDTVTYACVVPRQPGPAISG
jgi:hypothetical protein